MATKVKQHYSWFPKNGNCIEIFNSEEDAVKDAQERYDNGREPYEDGDEYTSVIINVGTVRYFDLRRAVTSLVEGIEDDIWEQLHDFASGCDMETECYVHKKDKDAFIKESTEALFPIIEKYIDINPEWVCMPEKRYDLENKKWIEQ